MNIKSGFVALSIFMGALAMAGPGTTSTAHAQAAGSTTVPQQIAQAPVAPSAADQPPPIRPMTTLEKMAAGCVVSGGGALTATYVIGPSELIMLLMGGMVVPSSSSVLLISLIGTMTSVACGAGAQIEPLVEWAFTNGPLS